MTNTDGLNITSSLYDLSTKTLTVNVSLDPTVTGYVPPTEIHLYEDNPNDSTFSVRDVAQPLQIDATSGTSFAFTVQNVTPEQLQAWLSPGGSSQLYADASSGARNRTVYYDEVQLTTTNFTSETTPNGPTISGDFTDAAGTIPAITTSGTTNYVSAVNNTQNQTLTGMAAANSLVTVSMTNSSGTQTFTTNALADGTWSANLGPLQDDTYSFTATASDGVTTSAASQPYNFTVVAPDAPTGLSDASISSNYVNMAADTPAQTLNGTADPGLTVTVYDGGTKLGTTTADPSGDWTYTLGTLGDGSHSLTATATDAAGNTGPASVPLTFTVDATAPTVTGITETPSSGDLGLGASVTFAVGVSEAVNVSGLGQGVSGGGNLVVNGGFETGDFTGWTETQNLGATFVSPSYAHSGNDGAALGAVGSDNSLAQTLSTVAGATYDVSFDHMYRPDAGPVGDFSVLWDGNAIYSQDSTNPPSPQNWTQYDFTVTGTGSDTLTFLSRQDPSYQGLDDVSVTQVSSSGPTLTLSNGATATYSGISSNGETLDFTYQVAPDGDTPALTVGSVNLNSTSVADAAGNQLNTSLAGISQSGPLIDTLTPTAAVSVSSSDVNLASNTATVTFGFNEAPVGFTAANINAQGGTLSGLTASADGLTYTATYTASANTDIANAVVSVDGAWTDAAGNPGAASSSTPFLIDTLTPTAAVSVSSSDVNLASNTATVTFGFNEAPVGFTAANINAQGGTLSGLTASADGLTYTATYTASANTDIANAVVSVDGAWTDAAGNPGAASSSTPFLVDTLTPTAAVSVSSSDVNLASNTATVTFGFNEAPVGFTAANINAQGGTLSGLTASADGLTYTATYTASANTDIANAVVSIDGAWTDAAGNPGAASSSTPFLVDTLTPTAAVSVSSSDVNLASNTATVTFGFNEAPVGFTAANINAQGGTLSGLTASADGLTYTATYTANANTDIANAVVSVDGAWTDAAGNPGAASSSTPFLIDTLTPTAAVSVSSSDVNLASNTATVTFGFNEAPVGFTAANINAQGGTLSGLTASADGLTYTATYTASANTDIANAVVSVDGAWTDAAGNPGAASSSTPFLVDTLTPTAAVSVSSSDVNLASNTATVTFGFNEAPVGFTAANINAQGGTLSGLTASADGLTYTATYTASANTDIANAVVSIDGAWTDAAGNPGAASSSTPFLVDTLTPTAAVSVSSSDVNLASNTATVTFGFNEAPVGFTAANINAQGGTLSGLTASADGLTYTATYTASANTDIANAVVSVDGAWTDAAGNPGAASFSTPFLVDTLTPSAPTGLADSSISNGYVNGVHDTAAQTLTGQAEAGSTVTVYNNGTEIGTTTTGHNGKWTYNLGMLSA